MSASRACLPFKPRRSAGGLFGQHIGVIPAVSLTFDDQPALEVHLVATNESPISRLLRHHIYGSRFHAYPLPDE